MPTVKDMGWESVRKSLKMGKNVRVSVGIQGPQASAQKEGATDPLTLAEVAAMHEYGIGVPRRSFLSDTFDLHQAELEELAKKVGTRILNGRMTPGAGMNILGMHMRNKVVERINDGIPPPNAPATIARKGSSTPLVDTGQLKSGITHVVEGL